MKKNKFTMLLEAVVGFPPAVVRRIKNMGRDVVLACNAFTPSFHKGKITKTSSVAIATRYLLGKSDGTQNGVTVCTTGDRAIYVIEDTVSATDLALLTPASVSALIIGVYDQTVPMIAAGAIAANTVVYPVANGQVNSYVGLGSTGTNYPVGITINASANAGDVLEVIPFISIASATV